ncbi:MAG: O-antigen ligase family protein [Clostridia bacterium]|nr:O-antigen ligase family protein [Clostridia bacterium]
MESSFFLGALASFGDWINRMVKSSGVYSWLDSSVLTEKYYDTSCFYKLNNWIWKKTLCVIRRFFLPFCKLLEGSVCLRIYRLTGNKLSIACLLALFLGGMFVLPHEKWNNLYFVLAIGGFGFWHVLRAVTGKAKAVPVRPRLSVIAFMAALTYSTLTATVPADAVRFFLFLLSSVLCAFCVQQVLDTEEKLTRFINILLLFVAITGIFGIVQRLMGLEVNPEFVDVHTNQGMPGRVFSTFSNPNSFAQLLVLFMPFFVPGILFSKTWRGKALLTVAFCITLVSLVMTYSRSGWVGMAISTVLFVSIYDKRWLIPMLLLAIAAIPFLPETVINRIFTIGSMEDSSNAYRLYIWQSCFSMIGDVGFTGLGLGPASFQAVYPAYASQVAVTAPHSHMLYLQIVLETGVLGAVSFFAYMLGVVKQTAGMMRYMNRQRKCYAAAGISALAGIAFVCLAEYIWFYPRVMFAFWVIPGLLCAIIKLTKRDKIERMRK